MADSGMVEDYWTASTLRLVYWRHTGPAYLLNNTSSPWPRITIYINPHSQTRQLITSHTPPLSIDLSLVPNKLSFQDVLVQCIKYRSLSILERLKKLFNDTPWENKAVLHSSPPCLSLSLSSSLVDHQLILSVDIRIGLVVASLEGVVRHNNELINKTLQSIEEELLHDPNQQSLIKHLETLLCQLHLFQLTCLSSSVGLSHSFSLPLLSPLPEVPSPVFIKLDHVTYLLVSVSIEGGVAVGGVTESYYMLRVFPSPYLPLVSDEQIPRSFFKIESLIRISTSSAFDHMTGIISMLQGTSKLKRK
ncbi:PREDICTED: uncharacterized protein LOC109585820, partial [Amphimedon queenslandica]|uniref:Mediator of RNA polymerase II transcription subunit 14 RM3 domain-containing protein n=2 Tax=Amphimedon queenslandica TaxID=400682 RepID=A0AAN0JL63_AMPQE